MQLTDAGLRMAAEQNHEINRSETMVGSCADALADLADVVLIDFNRDFCKPTMQIAGRRFSWHYDFDNCLSASSWLSRHARLEDEATHEYFVRWTERASA